MSQLGQKAKFACLWRIPALPQKADIDRRHGGDHGLHDSEMTAGELLHIPLLFDGAIFDLSSLAGGHYRHG